MRAFKRFQIVIYSPQNSFVEKCGDAHEGEIPSNQKAYGRLTWWSIGFPSLKTFYRGKSHKKTRNKFVNVYMIRSQWTISVWLNFDVTDTCSLWEVIWISTTQARSPDFRNNFRIVHVQCWLELIHPHSTDITNPRTTRTLTLNVEQWEISSRLIICGICSRPSLKSKKALE